MDDLRNFLRENKVDAEIIDLGIPMTTAEAAAEQLKIAVGGIFKSVVLTDPENNSYVVVVPGDRRINTNLVAKLVGAKKVKFASAEKVLEDTGYPAGGTPPIGHRKKIQVIIDEGLFAYEFGYGGGGRHELLLKISPNEIVNVTQGTVANVTQ